MLRKTSKFWRVEVLKGGVQKIGVWRKNKYGGLSERNPSGKNFEYWIRSRVKIHSGGSRIFQDVTSQRSSAPVSYNELSKFHKTKGFGRSRVKFAKHWNVKSQNHRDRPLKWDMWQEMTISMTHRVERSKGRLVKIFETRNHDLIVVVGWRSIVGHWHDLNISQFWLLEDRYNEGESHLEYPIREILTRLEELALGHREGSYGWRIREEMACIRPLLEFWDLGV